MLPFRYFSHRVYLSNLPIDLIHPSHPRILDLVDPIEATLRPPIVRPEHTDLPAPVLHPLHLIPSQPECSSPRFFMPRPGRDNIDALVAELLESVFIDAVFVAEQDAAYVHVVD